jgi:hypothetical protein
VSKNSDWLALHDVQLVETLAHSRQLFEQGEQMLPVVKKNPVAQSRVQVS